MKGEIISINKVFSEINYEFAYETVIRTKEIPKVKLGECEVKQK